MKLHKYSLTLSQKINLGNYNSTGYEVYGEILIDPDDTDARARDVSDLQEYLITEANKIKDRISR